MKQPMLILAWSFSLLLASAAPAVSPSPGADPKVGGSPPVRQLIVYSFHGQFRCYTCLEVEEYTRDTINEHFSDDVKTGMVVFRVIDLSQPENVHFTADYQLTSWSVALSLRENGKETRYKNLADIQDFVNDRQSFIWYLFGEVEAIIHGN